MSVMQNQRRQFLVKTAASSVGLFAASQFGQMLLGQSETKELSLQSLNGKKILFFTKSAGFEHSIVQRINGAPAFGERMMTNFAKKYGFELLITKDGRVFDSEYENFDTYFFYTSGDLTSTKVGNIEQEPAMTPRGKENLLAAIAAGKGFVGSHCASDTFHSKGARWENQEKPDPYIQMIGGEFSGHGSQQSTTMKVCDLGFPGVEAVGDAFSMQEEWYSLKNFASDMHVVLLQETNGMSDFDYQRPAYPATWARRHDNGRVFYTSMGHREDVWTNPIFESIVMGGLAWASGSIDHKIEPNLNEVAPEAAKLPRK